MDIQNAVASNYSLSRNMLSEKVREKFHKRWQILSHAYKCRNADCHLELCPETKEMIGHVKGQCLLPNGWCALCQRFVSVCVFHANTCYDNKCLQVCREFRDKMLNLFLKNR